MTLFKYIIILTLSTFLPTSLMAQREKKVVGTYTYVVPENITMEQARRTALDRAKIQAVADEFGTIVSQSNTTFIHNENGGSVVDIQSLGGSEVKGEWIETLGEPKFDQGFTADGQMWVRCTAKGRIREIVAAKIDLTAKVLRNGTEERFEATDFNSGDDMYIYFKSPVDGYLAIYLLDEIAKTVYCLLPYSQSSEAVQQIVHDRPYVFFSAKDAPQEQQSIVDEITMTCDNHLERNDLYIVFSPNAFAKANSNDGGQGLPRLLEWKAFNEWITTQRKRDYQIQLLTKQLTTRK